MRFNFTISDILDQSRGLMFNFALYSRLKNHDTDAVHSGWWLLWSGARPQTVENEVVLIHEIMFCMEERKLEVCIYNR